MKALLLACWIFIPSLARADTPPPAVPPGPPIETSPDLDRPALPEPAVPAEPTTLDAVPDIVQRLRAEARVAARRGHCDTVVDLGMRVREIDPAYYADTFSGDPVLASCVPAIVSTPRRTVDGPAAPVSQTIALLLSAGLWGSGVALVYADEYLLGEQSRYRTTVRIGAVALYFAGPTVGHAYAGNWWNTGLKIKLAGLATATLGFVVLSSSGCQLLDRCNEPGTATVGLILLGGGLLTMTAGTITEVITAPRTARRTNQARRMRAQLGVAPIATPSSTAPALVVAGRF